MEKTKKIEELINIVLSSESTTEDELVLFSEIYLIGYKIAFNVMSRSFQYQPLEIQDLFSVIYLVYIDTVRWFKLTQEIPSRFLKYFQHKVNFAIINECRSLTKNGHIVLNFGIALDDKFDQNASYDFFSEEKSMHKLLSVWSVYEQLHGLQREILKLKMDGYSVQKISQILKISQNQICYEWTKVKKKLVV